MTKRKTWTHLRFAVSLMLHAIICPWRVPWLHRCGRNARNVWQAICFKIVDSKKGVCASPESIRLCSEST